MLTNKKICLFAMFLISFATWLPTCYCKYEWRDNFYEYTVKNIDGKRVSLEKYRGTPSLVVNVASECGYTDGHYRDLVRLSQDPSIRHRLNILAFPCNQFGYQEPSSNMEIKHFVQTIYDVEFPLFAKVDVIGFDASPAWQYLSMHSGKEPNWNFWKYLVDQDGYVKNAWGPETSIDAIYDQLMMEAAIVMPNYRRYDDEF